MEGAQWKELVRTYYYETRRGMFLLEKSGSEQLETPISAQEVRRRGLYRLTCHHHHAWGPKSGSRGS